MIRWTKDGKVARDGWPKPQFPGDMTCMAEDLADALDVAVAFITNVAKISTDETASVAASCVLRQIGVEHD